MSEERRRERRDDEGANEASAAGKGDENFASVVGGARTQRLLDLRLHLGVFGGEFVAKLVPKASI